MGNLTLTSNLFLEKSELDQLQEFLQDDSTKFLFKGLTSVYGIVQQSILGGDDFLIQQGSSTGTVKLDNNSESSIAIDSDLLLATLPDFDDFLIPDDGLWYWMKVSHRYVKYEEGTVNVNLDGQVSGTDTFFTKNTRGQSSGTPTKVKFFKEDSNFVEQSILNNEIYEVIEVSGDGSMTLSGNFQAESNLRYVVVGSFTLGTNLSTEQKSGIYNYDDANVNLVLETSTDSPPATGFVSGKDFYITRVNRNGSTVTIQDKRNSYYWEIDFGLALNSKADRDASNVSTSVDIPSWLEKLMSYWGTRKSITNTVGVVQLTDNETFVDINMSAPPPLTLDLRLPLPSSKNLGKSVFFKIDLTTSSGAGYFYIRNNSGSITYFSKSSFGDFEGKITMWSDGSNWYVSQESIQGSDEYLGEWRSATQTERRGGSSSSVVMTPLDVVDVKTFTNGTITVTQSGGTYVIPDTYDVFYFTGSPQPSVTMPTPVGRKNKIVSLYKNIADGNVAIEINNTDSGGSQSSQFLPMQNDGYQWSDGSSSLISFDYISLISDGAKWHCLSVIGALLACPYIYINGEYFEEIIKNQVGIENYREETIDITEVLKVGNNVIRISEEKKETSFIDYLILNVDGRDTIFFDKRKTLQIGDFYDFNVNIEGDFEKATLRAKGYYIRG